jgi:hypothetical protein
VVRLIRYSRISPKWMRAAGLMVLAGCALASRGAPAQSQDAGPAASANAFPPSVAFDIGGGKYDQMRKDIPCGVDTVSGKVRIIALHDSSQKWVPMIAVFLNSAPAESGPAQRFALRFLTRFTNPNALASFEKAAGGKADTQYFDLPMNRSRPLSFTISWSAPGNITAAIDRGQKADFQIDGALKSVSLGVSGATASFEDVRLTRSGPQSPDCTPDPPKN